MQAKLINIKELKPSKIRQEVLPKGFIKLVLVFKETLKEVETSSLEETVSNFQRDLYPENELVIWEAIASIYQTEIRKRVNPTPDIKKKLFAKILKSTMFNVPDTQVGV